VWIGNPGPEDIFVIARSQADEAIRFLPAEEAGLLRGACHRAALLASPLARNHGVISQALQHGGDAINLAVEMPRPRFEADTIDGLRTGVDRRR
jgi:hypothetical protein